MESVVKSDIFFFITTICVLAITTFLLTILWHVLHIVKRFRRHIDLFYGEVDGFLNDLFVFRTTLRESQFGLKPVFDAIKIRADAFAAKVHKKSKPRTTKEKTVTEENTLI